MLSSKLESRSEFGEHRARRIAYHLQPAASRRAIGREARDDDLASRATGAANLRDVPGTVGRVGQEAEDGAIMPDREAA